MEIYDLKPPKDGRFFVVLVVRTKNFKEAENLYFDLVFTVVVTASDKKKEA